MTRPLLVLVPDRNLEKALHGLLQRYQALSIRPVEAHILVHPHRDPGVLRNAHEFLRPFLDQYECALVLFDREGCGAEEKTAEQLQRAVRERLERSGWEGRCQVIIIDPELETWVWTRSRHVAEILEITQEELDTLLTGGKPARPKEKMEEILQRNRIPRSSALYEDIARRVSLRGCTDRAFQLLCETLQHWFPEEP